MPGGVIGPQNLGTGYFRYRIFCTGAPGSRTRPQRLCYARLRAARRAGAGSLSQRRGCGVKNLMPFRSSFLGLVLGGELSVSNSPLLAEYNSQPISGEATAEQANHIPKTVTTVMKPCIWRRIMSLHHRRASFSNG